MSKWQHAMEYYQERTPQVPDFLVPLAGHVFASMRKREKSRDFEFAPMRVANAMGRNETVSPFGYLLSVLQGRFHEGKTGR